MTDTQQPEALRLAEELDAVPETGADPQTIQEAAAELRRLHAYCQELESHLILDCMTHVQNPAENEHVAGDVSKNGAELNMTCASHGQAPSQAAPAAVAVPTFEDFCKRHGLDPKKMDGHGGMWARVALDECRAITNQPAPQQEAQEPVAWYVTGGSRLLDEDEAKAEARHIGGTARAIPVYTAPQPSPAAQEGKKP